MHTDPSSRNRMLPAETPLPLRILIPFATTGLLGFVGSAQGKIEGEPYASAEVVYDSNLYRVADDREAIALNGSPEQSDTIFLYTVGAGLQYKIQSQRLYGGGEWRRQEFDRNSELDHDEHLLVGGLEWSLGPVTDGRIELREEERLESFRNRGNADLSIQTDRRAMADTRIAIMPEWLLQLKADTLSYHYSLERSRNYNLEEDGGRIALRRNSDSLVNLGVSYEYRDGRYPERGPNAGVPESYTQQTLQLTAEAKTPVSLLRAEIGRSDRQNEGLNVDDVSGVTGEISWRREQTDKHTLRLKAFRRVNSVDQVNSNAALETGFGGGVDWLIGANALLQADYEWSKSEFDGSPIGSLGLDQIEDRQQRAELSVVYRPVFWFSLTPELAYERTSSNRQVREFDDVRVGLIVEFRYD